MMSVLALTCAFLTLTLAAQTAAQEPAPTQTSTLTITTRLVSLDAVVRDAHGNLVTNLTKDSFTLREDGHAVPIRYFNHDSDLPLTVGLLIDTSGSEAEYFGDEARNSSLFLENVIRPAPTTTGLKPRADTPATTTPATPTTQQPDRAFIVRFDSQVLLLQPMTSSLPLLRNGLRRLDYKPDPLKKTQHGGTLLFDAIVIVCEQVIAKETGRRALIVMTDGDDNGSQSSLDAAIRAAQAAGVAVYSILYTNEPPGYPTISSVHPSGIHIMEQISAATGGRAFLVGGQMSVRQIYAAIEDDLRSQYRMGFTPAASQPHAFHKLDLRTNVPKLTVQSRTRYTTPE